MSGLRLALVTLLVVSTALFAAGAIAERSQADEHAEPASVQGRESGESADEPEGAHAEDSESAGASEGQASSAQSDERETVLGVDVESTPLIVLAVIAGLGLAMLVAAPLGRAVLLTIAAIVVAWAALDVREAVHQIDESRSAIAILAIGVAALHLTAAAVAARLAARERADIGSPGRPGTLPVP